MQIVIATILIGYFALLLWSLWYVLTNPRRRARQAATELNAPVEHDRAQLVVGIDLWKGVGMIVFFAFLSVNGAVEIANAATAAIATSVFGGMVVVSLCITLRNKQVLIISMNGIVMPRQERNLSWRDIEKSLFVEGRLNGVNSMNSTCTWHRRQLKSLGVGD